MDLAFFSTRPEISAAFMARSRCQYHPSELMEDSWKPQQEFVSFRPTSHRVSGSPRIRAGLIPTQQTSKACSRAPPDKAVDVQPCLLKIRSMLASARHALSS